MNINHYVANTFIIYLLNYECKDKFCAEDITITMTLITKDKFLIRLFIHLI